MSLRAVYVWYAVDVFFVALSFHCPNLNLLRFFFPEFSIKKSCRKKKKKASRMRKEENFYGNSSAIYHSTLTVQFSYQLNRL